VTCACEATAAIHLPPPRAKASVTLIAPSAVLLAASSLPYVQQPVTVVVIATR
jgi:hypothetical protein